MKLNGKFLCSRLSSLVRGLFPIPGSSRIVRNNGSDLLSRRDISIKLLSCNIFGNVFFCLSLIYLVSSKLICLLRSCSRLLVAPDELGSRSTHRVFSDSVHRLLVTLSFFSAG